MSKNKKRIYLFLVIIFLNLLFISPSFCQNNNDSTFFSAKNIIYHSKEFFLPKFDNVECNEIINTITLTGFSFFFDKKINTISNDKKLRSKYSDNIFKLDNYYGNAGSAIIIIGGTFIASNILNDSKTEKISLMLLESVLFSNIITQTLKITIGRERPEFTDNCFHFVGPNLGNERYQSFPSGHATTAFAISTIFANTTDNNYLKILFYSPAFITSFSRLYNNKHWFSDVILAGLIGYYSAQKVLRINGELQNETNLDISFNTNGISLKLFF